MRLACPSGQVMFLAPFSITMAILGLAKIASGNSQSQFFANAQTSLEFKRPNSAQIEQYLSVSQTANIKSTFNFEMAELPTNPGQSSTPDLVRAAPMMTDQDGGINPVATATFTNIDHGLIVQADYDYGPRSRPLWPLSNAGTKIKKKWCTPST